ncbi:MAG: hypothetical protein DRO67_09995 [Candidatus Asgardarchaeum californiense]|nr:MAG: hypothetical protein DRO67_09995 [Candidatus Asgardarchaeum californiense]
MSLELSKHSNNSEEEFLISPPLKKYAKATKNYDFQIQFLKSRSEELRSLIKEVDQLISSLTTELWSENLEDVKSKAH